MRFLLFTIFCFLSLSLFGQKEWSLGGGFVNNVPVSSNGFVARANVHLNDKFIVSPSFKHFLQSNKISENYYSLQLNFLLLSSMVSQSFSKKTHRNTRPDIYALASVDYNEWLNYTPTINARAKEKNILPFVGMGGMVGSRNIRFYGESRYNFLWKEATVEFGVMVFPKQFKSGDKGLRCPKKM